MNKRFCYMFHPTVRATVKVIEGEAGFIKVTDDERKKGIRKLNEGGVTDEEEQRKMLIRAMQQSKEKDKLNPRKIKWIDKAIEELSKDKNEYAKLKGDL